ncbi:MAG: DUF4406 domain-containing protein [Spirochaetales bacterium]|jgi:hypothetical protein|nr:DUF4406 domain-containing protein [Spirochaetales bacterium]
MKTVYIIGKTISQDLEYKEAYELMAKWESTLKGIDLEIVNPLKLFSEHTPIKAAQKQVLEGFLKCDAVLLLSNWSDTAWGRIEFQLAHLMGYDLYSENDYRFLKNMSETLRAATPLVDIPEESSKS